MKSLAFLACTLLYHYSVLAQEKVYRAQENSRSNSGFLITYNNRPELAQQKNVFGNFVLQDNWSKDAFFYVYTRENVDAKFASILDSLAQYKKDYSANRQQDFDSTKIFIVNAEKNLKQSIDGIPQVILANQLATNMKNTIIQEIKDNEIADLQKQIADLQDAVKALKAQIEAKSTKKSN
jgi:cyclophilin family peptidyl-prolyl cis-trans isomerase